MESSPSETCLGVCLGRRRKTKSQTGRSSKNENQMMMSKMSNKIGTVSRINLTASGMRRLQTNRQVNCANVTGVRNALLIKDYYTP